MYALYSDVVKAETSSFHMEKHIVHRVLCTFRGRRVRQKEKNECLDNIETKKAL